MSIYYEMHYRNRMEFGNANKVIINEDKLDDDTIKRFLVSMLLTMEWSNDFEDTLIEYDDESVSYHISDYLHQIKLLKFSKHPDYRYEVSQAGRRWLEKQQKRRKQ